MKGSGILKLWSVAKLDKTKAGEIQSRYELPALVADRKSVGRERVC